MTEAQVTLLASCVFLAACVYLGAQLGDVAAEAKALNDKLDRGLGQFGLA